jgi:hypothetical protein
MQVAIPEMELQTWISNLDINMTVSIRKLRQITVMAVRNEDITHLRH